MQNKLCFSTGTRIKLHSIFENYIKIIKVSAQWVIYILNKL